MSETQAAQFDDAHAGKCSLAAESLRSSGYLRLGVTGWSMLPAVLPGDTLLIERASHGEVSDGDIVLFARDRRLFVHRIVSKGETHLLTRGDAMPQGDSPVPVVDVLGKVILIVRGRRSLRPTRSRTLLHRAGAALFRRSDFAARVMARVHNLRQASRTPEIQTQSHRAVPCPN